MTNDIVTHDFVPAVAEAPRRYKASRIILLSAVAFIGATAWASVAHLDQISRASGQIVPAGKVQIVQAPDGGQISKILVREGDRVRRGQDPQVRLGDPDRRAYRAAAIAAISEPSSIDRTWSSRVFPRWSRPSRRVSRHRTRLTLFPGFPQRRCSTGSAASPTTEERTCSSSPAPISRSCRCGPAS